MKYCFSCGNELYNSAEICPKCGTRQKESKPNRVITAIFALVLGGLGIHRFYMKKIISGILYLIFCWTFIPIIISFIEAIVYLCQSDESFEKTLQKSYLPLIIFAILTVPIIIIYNVLTTKSSKSLEDSNINSKTTTNINKNIIESSSIQDKDRLYLVTKINDIVLTCVSNNIDYNANELKNIYEKFGQTKTFDESKKEYKDKLINSFLNEKPDSGYSKIISNISCDKINANVEFVKCKFNEGKTQYTFVVSESLHPKYTPKTLFKFCKEENGEFYNTYNIAIN